MSLPAPTTARTAEPRVLLARRGLARVAAPAAGALFLARAAISGIHAKLGHPGATLDDAYIHFQYARAIAEGHPLRFQAGEPMTSGATSLLWPALLSPFYALGLREERILWAAWLFSFAALGLLAYEAYALTARLAGKGAAVGAGAMVLAFGGFVWCAASGMEVVPFAWILARAARKAAEWGEATDGAASRSSTRRAELLALAWGAALFRPEGAAAALFVAAALLLHPRAPTMKERAFGLLAAAGAVATPVLLWMTTGHTASATMVAKLMPGNPYYAGDALVAAVRNNASLLVGTLLNGEVWSAEFLPQGSAPFAVLGLASVIVLGWRKRLVWRAAAVVLIAVLMFAPCFYVTFLWNRLRYLWPFATGWIVGLACLSRLVADVAAAGLTPRARIIGPLVCGGFAGLFVAKLEWVLDDVAQSASGIDRQQVALGRWAKEHLPEDARIGVNDTGAIAYFGDRRTFDVVGLTTADEARYWVAGAASRFEHYERLRASRPAALPTHFIVYPEWMGLDAVLGQPLHQATVTDSTILGGQTMRVYEADYALLGSGERPWTPLSGSPGGGVPLDALDVADLESEAEHRYELLEAHDGEQTVRVATTPEGTVVADGGRGRRTRERFVAHLRPGIATAGVVRLETADPAHVTVIASGAVVATFDTTGGDWEEIPFAIPGERVAAETPFDWSVEGAPAVFFHYWFFEAR